MHSFATHVVANEEIKFLSEKQVTNVRLAQVSALCQVPYHRKVTRIEAT